MMKKFSSQPNNFKSSTEYRILSFIRADVACKLSGLNGICLEDADKVQEIPLNRDLPIGT